MKKGFTLVELLTSVAIFGFASAIVVGLLIYATNLQRAIIAQQKLLDEASYVMEYMSRALKFAQRDDLGSCIDQGKNYKVQDSGPYNNAKITFLYPNPHSPGTTICRSFFLDEDSLRLKENRDGVVEDFITSSSIKVTDLRFEVRGDNTGHQQPRVTIMMVLKSKGTRPEEQALIRLQTTISQRNLNI